MNALDGSGESEDGEDALLTKRDTQAESDDEDQYKRFLLENVGKEEMEKALALKREVEQQQAKDNAPASAEDDDFLKK